MTERRAIVVLAMHRGGTSALTRTLNLLGAAIPGQVLPPVAADNEAGYWEPREVTDIQDAVLSALDDSPYSYARLPLDERREDLAEHENRLLEFLEREAGAAPLVVIKDPRTCRLVPLWLRVLARFGAEPRFLLWARHPLEVAASLRRRSELMGVSEHLELHAHLFWLRCFLDAERDTRGQPRACGGYEELLTDWRSLVERIAGALDLPELLPEPAAAAAVDAFLRPDLRHHRFAGTDLDRHPVLGGWVRQIYDELRRAAREGREPSAELFDAIREPFEDALAVFQPVLESDETRRLWRAVDSRDRRLAALAGAVASREARIVELDQEREDLSRRAGELERRLSEAESSLDGVLSSRSWRLTRHLRWLAARLRGNPR